MKVLVVGSGGREHALAWKIAQSDRVQEVFVAPGNAGTDADPQLTNVKISATDVKALLDFAKAFMKRHNIPTADYETFTDPVAAANFVRSHGAPIVIKADGLAAGKGVIVAMTVEEALRAVEEMLEGNKFGSAGSRVVIEEFLEGEEASFIVACDGKHILPMATSQDHKRLLDRDQGPNTGGMGAYSPAPVITPDLHNQVMRQVIQPTVSGMAEEGIPFTGFLYAGLMIGRGSSGTPSIKVLEFNCRMGDPETEPIMARIKSDLSEVFEASFRGELGETQIDWDRRSALGVVCAAEGYPEHPRKGDVIEALPRQDAEHLVFHAGTVWNQDHRMAVGGGRVLCVVGLGESLKIAQKTAYEAVAGVKWKGMQYRSDIGWRALK